MSSNLNFDSNGFKTGLMLWFNAKYKTPKSKQDALNNINKLYQRGMGGSQIITFKTFGDFITAGTNQIQNDLNDENTKIQIMEMVKNSGSDNLTIFLRKYYERALAEVIKDPVAYYNKKEIKDRSNFGEMSSNNKIYIAIAILAVIGYYLYKKRKGGNLFGKKRRN